MPEPIGHRAPGPIPHHEDWGGTGPSLEEAKRAQRPNVKAAVEEGREIGHEVLKGVGEHVVEHPIEHGLEKAGHATAAALMSFLSYAKIGYEGTKKLHELVVDKPTEQGKELAQARDADAARYVIAAVVQTADPTILPDGYLAEAHRQVVGSDPGATQFRNPAFQVAGNIAGQAANGDPEAVQFRDTMKRCVSEGVALAHAKDLRTPEALAELREHDPEFEKRWEADAGFQVGVRAAIWQAQNHPDQFDAANRERAELQMSLRTTRYA